METKLSHSSLRLFSECGQRYKYHYVDRVRETVFHSALAFGSAIDEALNDLLIQRDLPRALKIFDSKWTTGRIGSSVEQLATNLKLVYGASDFDEALLSEGDLETCRSFLGDQSPSSFVKEVQELKSTIGWDNLEAATKGNYNYVNWLSMRRKGHAMLKSYHDKILPQIFEVVSIQEEISLENEEGDKITGFVDFVATMRDGKNYVLDNKTSARAYDEDSAARSQQLVLYYHTLKEKYNLAGVGFIVLNKNIRLNKSKTCSLCKHEGEGSRAKTCDNEIEGKRCGGAWDVVVDPDCYIQTVLNEVTPESEALILDNFIDINQMIKLGIFYKNLAACKNGNLICPYINLCHKGSMKGLEKS